jgi:sensor histidine kinase YesM
MSTSYRRSVFLVNKPFQIRFAIYVCSFLIALSAIYPLIVHNLFDYFINRLDPMGPSVEAIESTRNEIVWLLVFLQATFLTACFIISVFMSHRIAGPLFKLRKFMANASKGQIGEKLSFRKADYFREIALEYNGMMSGIRGIIDKNMEAVSATIAQIERAKDHTSDPAIKKDLEDALTTLRSVRQDMPR